MEKYTKGLKEKLKPRVNVDGQHVVEPFRDAHLALQRAAFASQQKEEFFNEAFQDIMISLFTQWVKTEPHAVKEREYLYHSILALGSVKEMLIAYEMLGQNTKYMQAQEGANKGEK